MNIASLLGYDGSLSTLISLICVSAILGFAAYLVLSGGMFGLSFVAFGGFGGYVAAIFAADHGIGVIPALLVAVAVSVPASLLLFLPLRRLSGMYLALVSIAVVSVFDVLATNLGITGGPIGIVLPSPGVSAVTLFIVVVVLAGAMGLIQHSAVGRAMRIMRGDPIAAASLGVNVGRMRLSLYVASSAVAAVGGVLRTYYLGVILPTDYSFDLLITLVAAVVLGGVGYWSGPVVGAAIWTLLPEWLRPLGTWSPIGNGVVLLAVVLLLPQGVVGGIGGLVRALRWRRRTRLSGRVEIESVIGTAMPDASGLQTGPEA